MMAEELEKSDRWQVGSRRDKHAVTRNLSLKNRGWCTHWNFKRDLAAIAFLGLEQKLRFVAPWMGMFRCSLTYFATTWSSLTTCLQSMCQIWFWLLRLVYIMGVSFGSVSNGHTLSRQSPKNYSLESLQQSFDPHVEWMKHFWCSFRRRNVS